MEVGGQRHAPAPLPPGKRPGTHCTGGRLGPRAGLDGFGRSRPHRDSMPGPCSLTGLSRPTYSHRNGSKSVTSTLTYAKCINLIDEPGRLNEKPSTSHLCSSSLIPSLCLVIPVTGVLGLPSIPFPPSPFIYCVIKQCKGCRDC